MKLSSIPAALRFVLTTPKQWTLPKRAEVLIYDRNGSEVFGEYLAPGSVQVMDVRGESINVPTAILTCLRHGINADFAKYQARYVSFVRPKVVLTHIDNTVNFYLLKRGWPKPITIAVQNGARDDVVFEIFRSASRYYGGAFKADHIFCFGRIVGDRYREVIEAKIEPRGSFMNNLVPRRTQNSEARSVLFISQYRPPHPGYYPPSIPLGERMLSLSDLYAPERWLLPRLAEYCQAHGFAFQICGCNLESPEMEREFFAEILGDRSWTFLARTGLAESYERLDMARCAVFVDSTLGYEALGRGVKAASFSLRGPVTKTDDRGFGLIARYPDQGPFWTNLQQESEVSRVMDYVSTVTDAQWQKDRRRYIDDIVAYDPGNSRFVELLRHYNIPMRELTADVQR